MNGKCVKLVQGKPETGIEVSNDPVKVAEVWEREGAEVLHVVDLDAAIFGIKRNRKIVEEILGKVKIPVEVGGGIRSLEDVISLIRAGAQWVILGTMVLERPETVHELLKNVKPSQLIIAFDFRKNMVLTRGWTVETSHSIIELIEFFEPMNVAAFLLTDVEVEGTLQGVKLQNLFKLTKATRIPIIYAGGVSSVEEILELFRLGVKGVVLGRALYEQRLKLRETVEYVKNALRTG